MEDAKIPIVDIGKLSLDNCNSKDWQTCADEFCEALHKIGFVYVINHGMDEHTTSEAFEVSRKFFSLPLESKMKHYMDNATEGYHPGLSQNDMVTRPPNPLQLRESFDFFGSKNTYYKIPSLPEFDQKILAMEAESRKRVVPIILRLLGKSLQLKNEDYFLRCCSWLDSPTWDGCTPSYKTFRTLFYPKIPETVELNENHYRVKEHSDFGFLTLLFQDEVGGLEVKNMDNAWMNVKPLKGAILINIGDMLEMWTGGYFVATKHMVKVPDSNLDRQKSRQSMVYFVHPDASTEIYPLESDLLGVYNFKPFIASEFAQAKLDRVNSY